MSGTTGSTGSTSGSSATSVTSAQPTIFGRPTVGAAGLTVQPVSPAQVPSGGGGQSGAAPTSPSSGVVRLRDVARIELGAQNYNQAASFDGRPSVGLGIHQLPGTNALDVADRIRKKMEELKQRFPEGVDYQIAYDITPFIRESVQDVVRTLVEAVGLVALVVLVFLQSWRSALIPLIAVPVAVVGTFAVMAALGFSLNNISLFGLVLAIGIVVDDAIVVVENVERWLEQGAAPREAARRAMDEVTGPVIAVALVLCAVFVPCAFIGGITGRFFRQFAVTIAASTAISAFNSLTLSPALAAILLKPRAARPDPLTRALDFTLGWFFRLFNRTFGAGTAAYVWVVDRLLRGSLLALPAYVALVGLTWWIFARAPTGFVPEQDQGRLIVNLQLPDSASLQRTNASLAVVEQITRATPGVAHTATVAGMSLLLGANSSNFATMFVILDPFEARRDPSRSDRAILNHILKECALRVGDGQVTGFRAPPIPGLSVTGGFKLMVEDHADMGPASLERQTNALIAKLVKSPGVAAAFTQFRSRTPQLFADVDRTKVASLGVALGDVNQAMEVFLGSSYVTSFNEFGRHWQVTLQAEGRFRSRVVDVNLIQVRNRYGGMVPLGTLANLREINGPVMALRYNLYPAAPITGSTAPGTSPGEVIAAAQELARQTLPRTMSTEWTELFYIQIKAGNTAIDVFLLAVVFVFLALAALYESWTLPLAVILVVPLCLLCSVAGVLFRSGAVDIFVQIGLVVLVGLACKNSILIVEFAQQLRQQGRSLRDATLEACRLRLRPILMTSFAFILGVVPLVVAAGAGAEMRRSLGTAVFSGMLGVTVFGIFMTPVFFFLIGWAGERPLFASGPVQWVGSVVLGGLAGLAAGALMWDVGVFPPAWALGGGGALGILAAVLGRGTFRGLLPRAAARPAGEPRGGRQP
jgi:multidrug efflux pump